jgi:hypothetical protein
MFSTDSPTPRYLEKRTHLTVCIAFEVLLLVLIHQNGKTFHEQPPGLAQRYNSHRGGKGRYIR